MGDDFASLFGSSTSGPAGMKRANRGDAVTGTVVHHGDASLYVDIGGTADARLDISEFNNAGRRLPNVGDKIQATVTGFDPGDVPVLGLALGRGAVDTATLEAALQNDVPVEGVVTKAVKAGLEVQIGGTRGFCPASQVERSFTAELDSYVGQTLHFRIVEIKEEGRNIIISRRALLEAQRAEEADARMEQLEVGQDVEGVVTSVQKFGAIVDVGGVEGLVHISELSQKRVERIEDAIAVDDRVTVRVLGIEKGDKGPRIRLSVKALQAPVDKGPGRDEVLKGVVTRVTSFGVFVETKKGEGLVPTRDLDLPTGSDHRRAFPPGKELEVVMTHFEKSSGKIRFSMNRVDEVRERQNFREYAGEQKAGKGGMGSLGELMRKKLGLPEPEPAPVEVQSAKADDPRPAEVQRTSIEAAAPTEKSPAAVAVPKQAEPPAKKAQKPAGPRPEPPAGVIRRKKR